MQRLCSIVKIISFLINIEISTVKSEKLKTITSSILIVSIAYLLSIRLDLRDDAIMYNVFVLIVFSALLDFYLFEMKNFAYVKFIRSSEKLTFHLAYFLAGILRISIHLCPIMIGLYIIFSPSIYGLLSTFLLCLIVSILLIPPSIIISNIMHNPRLVQICMVCALLISTNFFKEIIL